MYKFTLLILCLLTLTLLACQSATQFPTSTLPPTATPLPPALTEPEAEVAAREWLDGNLPQVRSDIGRSIAGKTDTLLEVSADFKASVLESSQEWEQGRADTELNWVGASVKLEEQDRWEVRLEAETITNVEHEGLSGQLKAVTPFVLHGTGKTVENYEVLLEQTELTLAGLQVKADLGQQLLEKEQVDSALESLPSNPFGGN